MTYLERYLQGDCEGVWHDLIALGEKVREPDIYPDALAVAQETMRRAKYNVELLYQRLRAIGYHFQLDDFEQLSSDAPRLLRQQIEANPLYKSIMQMGYGNMDDMEADFLKKQQANQRRRQRLGPKPVTPPTPAITDNLDDFEKRVGLLPLSVRAWCESVGMVNFTGSHPGLTETTTNDGEMLKLMSDPLAMLRRLQQQMVLNASASSTRVMLGDPLVIWFDGIDADLVLDWMDDDEENEDLYVTNDDDGARVLSVALNASVPAAQKGGYTDHSRYAVRVPNGAADAILENTGTTFVGYLRRSFAWGGFPGLESYPEKRDDALIAHLKEGLLPL